MRGILASPAYTTVHTSRGRGVSRERPRRLSETAVGDVFVRFSGTSHLVWGRVVPDIPAFCRELVAALAGEG